MPTEKLYAGLGPMLDGISDAVSNRLAAEKCTHGIGFNEPCQSCELEDAIEGQNDSEAAAEEDFGRINP